jgi:tetratricopeptide (TPR) repeat protein
MLLLPELSPETEDIYFQRGDSRANLQDYRGAIEDYNWVIKVDTNLPECYFNRGICRLHLKEYTTAILDFNKSIELNPRYAQAYYNR